MIRVLTILGAIAVLVLPAAQYIDDALGTGVGKLGASVALAAPGVATDEPGASAVLGLVYRGAVAVGEDGNGVRSARFATTVAGSDVRYVLLIENGCSGIQSDSVRPCPAPVRDLTVTLNDDVVFQNDDELREARLEIPLNRDEADENSLVLAAKGAPGSGARVRILALRQPVKPKSKPPVQVLGLVYRGAVAVGEDGNGVRSARFATTVAGSDVRYVLLIENGCSGIQSDSVRPCPAPVRDLTVTLNDDVVFQNDDELREARLEIPLNRDEADENSLVLAAKGAPGSGARVRILALRQPVKPKSKPPVQVLGLVYRGAVAVGEDGNGVRSARFATTVAGSDVRYVLLIENGCSGIQSDSVRPCPAPVRDLTVTLNDDVVFQNDDELREARLEIPLNRDEADENSLVLAAKGAPGSGARVRILALRQPVKPKSKPPVQVLGLVYRGAVAVGEDGNGVRSARFATTVAGSDVRYVLLIENGCSGIQSDSVRPCPAPVRDLTVTLNDDVVFQNDDELREARLEIPLNRDEADENSLVLAAKGAPGSGARVRILALREAPLDQA